MNKLTKNVLVLLLIFIFVIADYLKIARSIYAANPTITEYHITKEPSDTYLPRISGSKIVWQEYRNGNADIYISDVSDPNNPIEKQITNDVAWQGNPDIYGNIIVWDDKRINNQHDIYMADISDLNNIIETRVTTDPGKQNAPDICGNIITWEDYRNGEPDIYIADVTDKNNIIETQVTTNPEPQYAVGIDGNILVWEDKRNYGKLGRLSDVYMADISNLNNIIETKLTTDEINGAYPQVSNNKVVWYDFEGTGDPHWVNNVYIADISNPVSAVIKKITNGVFAQFDAEIDGNIVVWDDQRTGIGKDNIYMADVTDLNNIKETQVSNSNKAGAPAISGNKITWSDRRNDPEGFVGHIYLATFSYPDVNAPLFTNLPNESSPINISDGQYITSNPYLIKVKPTDNIAISNVKFYIDDILICTIAAADVNGIYSCSWDTSKYHSAIKAIAYDTSNNPSEVITRTTIVDPTLYIGKIPALTELPATGKN